MKIPPNNPASNNCRVPSGFTIIELLTAMVIGIVVVGGIVTLSVYTAQNYLAMTNYVEMDNQSRNALDNISREVRNASALMSFSTNNPQTLLLTNSLAGTWTKVTYNYDASAGTGTLSLEKSNEGAITLLTECDSFGFQLFNRYPTANLSFYSSTNSVTKKVDAKFCKVINMSWKCSRKILGSKLNTEIVQTAQVVLRNQVTQ